MEKIVFGAGKTIFEQGDASDKIYLILAGSVDIVILGRDGSERCIASLGPDEIFGEMGILSPAPRSATAIAREPTACEVFPANDFINLMSTDPEKAMELVKSLVLRLRNADRRLAAKAPPHPPKRPGSN